MRQKTDDKLDKLTKEIQKNLDGKPAILIGSGGSVPYGLPSMNDLATEIISKLGITYSSNENWKVFVSELEKSDNLELSLDKLNLYNDDCIDILHSIILTVWSFVDKKDKEAINNFLTNSITPALTSIINKFVLTTGATNIITTNYDRIIEYAIDCSGAVTETGFRGYCMKSFNYQSFTTNKRTVNLYKVHGSVDWFRHNENRKVISTNIYTSDSLLNNYSPVIVTPGIMKYRETHNEPFREVISAADKALRDSCSYLCIGYGFNDEHIQPIIIDENRNKNKPIVIITKEVTEKIKDLFLEHDSHKCLIISGNGTGGSQIYYSNTETEIFPENLWSIENFYKLWLE